MFKGGGGVNKLLVEAENMPFREGFWELLPRLFKPTGPLIAVAESNMEFLDFPKRCEGGVTDSDGGDSS